MNRTQEERGQPSTPDDERVFAALSEEGYRNARRLPSGEVAAIMPMLFTVGLFVGCARWTYRLRYCYERMSDAVAALDSWDGAGDPSGPWIKAKGYGLDMQPRDDLGPGATATEEAGR